MIWDYFICHASEDKDLVARPLAYVLSGSGFQVWYDEFSLRVGDSLSHSISRGMAESSFGVVVLSPAFMQKTWTQHELGGVWAREITTKGFLLPVWHRVNASQVRKHMPMLADRVAVLTDRGLQYVAEEIVRASFPDRIADLPGRLLQLDKTVHARNVLRALIDRGAMIDDLRLFLSAHQELIPRGGLRPAIEVNAEGLADFVFVKQVGVTGPMQMDLVLLGPCAIDAIEVGEAAVSLITALMTQLGPKQSQKPRDFGDTLASHYVGEYVPLLQLANSAVRVLTGKWSRLPESSLEDLSLDDIEKMRADENIYMRRPHLWKLKVLVIIGRRSMSTVSRKRQIVSAFDGFIEIASYDRLLDISS